MKRETGRMLILLVVLVVVVAFSFYVSYKYNHESSEGVSDNLVVEVIDGDTFRLYSGAVVRMICVDSPEEGDHGYLESKEFLSSLILDEEVILERDVEEYDAYGRLLGYVYADGLFVNREMVRLNYAEIFRYGNSTSRCDEIEFGESP